MIEIAVNIYEYRLDTEKQLGIFYEFNADEDASLRNSEVFLPGTENVFDEPIRALDLTGSFAELDYGSIDFNIKTAMADGRATIISNPTILVSNNEEAVLVSGEEVPLTVLEVKGNNTKLKTETRPTGIKLVVTPRIFSQDKVMMNIEIESSEITRFDVFEREEGGNRFELPVVTKRNIRTVVIIPSEQQIYIGGLYTNNTGDLIRKIPIAGDLPGIGFFLRGFNKTKNQTETVFQITPTIRRPGDGIATEDTIFQELLRTEEEAERDMQRQNRFIQDSEESSLMESISPPADDLILDATEAEQLNDPRIMTPEEENAEMLETPGSSNTGENSVLPSDVQSATGTAENQQNQTSGREQPDNDRVKTKDIFQRPERYQR